MYMIECKSDPILKWFLLEMQKIVLNQIEIHEIKSFCQE